MVDTVLVAVRESVQYLNEVALRIVLGEPAALGDSIEQLAAMAQPVNGTMAAPGGERARAFAGGVHNT